MSAVVNPFSSIGRVRRSSVTLVTKFNDRRSSPFSFTIQLFDTSSREKKKENPRSVAPYVISFRLLQFVAFRFELLFHSGTLGYGV